MLQSDAELWGKARICIRQKAHQKWNCFLNYINVYKFSNCVQSPFVWCKWNLFILKMWKIIWFFHTCVSSAPLLTIFPCINIFFYFHLKQRSGWTCKNAFTLCDLIFLKNISGWAQHKKIFFMFSYFILLLPLSKHSIDPTEILKIKCENTRYQCVPVLVYCIFT